MTRTTESRIGLSIGPRWTGYSREARMRAGIDEVLEKSLSRHDVDAQIHPQELRDCISGREKSGYELIDHCIDGIYWTLLWERK